MYSRTPGKLLNPVLVVERYQHIVCCFRALQDEYERLKVVRAQDMNGNASSYSPSESNRDAELQAEAKVLRQHKGRLEARMQILEDHNKQLEAQLQRLRQLLEQVSRQNYSDYSCTSS